MFGKGLSLSGNILDLGVENGFVTKSGAWFSIGKDRIGQGRENAKMYLETHPDVMRTVENQIREKFELPLLPPVEKSAEVPEDDKTE